MGCSACGSSNVLVGSLSAHKKNLVRQSQPKVQGYSGSGVIKSQKRLREHKAEPVVESKKDEEVK